MENIVSPSLENQMCTLASHSVISTDPPLCSGIGDNLDGLLILFSHSLVQLTSGAW